MKLTNQERQIKQKMQGLKSQVDKQELWGALADHVPMKKKRKYLGLLWLIPIGLLLGGTGLWLIPKSTITKKSADSKVIQSAQIQTKVYAKSSDDNQVSNPKTVDQNNTNQFPGNRETNSSKSNTISIQKSEDLKTNTRNVELPVAHYDDNSGNNSASNIVEITTIDETQQAISLKRNSISISNIHGLKAYIKSDKELIGPMELMEPLVYEYSKTSIPLFQFYLSGAKINHNVHFNDINTETNDHTNYLNSISSPKLSGSISTGINIQLVPRVQLSTGLKASQLVLEYAPNWERTIEEEIIGLSGSSQSILKQSQYYAIGHNYHYLLDIPIGLKLNLIQRSKWHIFAETGIHFNLLRSSKGFYTSTDQKLVAHSKSIQGPYHETFKNNWYVGLSIERKINPNWSIYCSPYYEKKNINYSINDILLKEEYQILNLKFGFLYSL